MSDPYTSVTDYDREEAHGAARFDRRDRRERIFGDDAPTRGELEAEGE